MYKKIILLVVILILVCSTVALGVEDAIIKIKHIGNNIVAIVKVAASVLFTVCGMALATIAGRKGDYKAALAVAAGIIVTWIIVANFPEIMTYSETLFD